MLKYGRKAVHAYSWKNLKKCLEAPSEIRQRKRNTVRSHLYVESKQQTNELKTKLTDRTG